MPVIRTRDVVRGPTVPLRGNVDSQKSSAIRTYSLSQTVQHKKNLLEDRKKAKSSTDDVLDFGAYLDIYRDDFDEENSTEYPSELRPVPDIEDQALENPDEGWEDVEDEETQLYREAEAFYRTLDHRTRRNKIFIDQQRWRPQIEGMATAYMDYCFRRAEGGAAVDDERIFLQSTKAIDVFGITSVWHGCAGLCRVPGRVGSTSYDPAPGSHTRLALSFFFVC
ncbi:hypothetical protein F5880DRAFT_1619477 [Lentinula raphanica]|nr:hypothetical protein F5880DRAFT_1619477 [Lentinula raphanica]